MCTGRFLIFILLLTPTVFAQPGKRGASVWTGAVSTVWHEHAQLNGETCTPMRGPVPQYTNNWGFTSCHPVIPDLPLAGSVVVIPPGSIVDLHESATIDQIELQPLSLLNIVGSPSVTTFTTSEVSLPNTIDGTIVINRDASDTAILAFDSMAASLAGSGFVVLNHDGSGAQLNTTATGILTISANQAIFGHGQINANLVNYGHIVADSPGKTLEFNAFASGIVNINLIYVRPTSTLVINDGSLFSQATDGAFILQGTVTMTSGALEIAEGLLIGDGILNGDLVQSNIVSPGLPVGDLQVNGNYQSNSGELVMEIGGTTAVDDYDVLAITGTADLTGDLFIVPVNGFIPQPGHVFVLVTAGTISQQVTNIVSSGTYTESYVGEQLTLTVLTSPNTPDLNSDTIVNILDMIEVASAIITTNRVAAEDMNGDGEVGLDDILMVGVNWSSSVMSP